MTSVISICKDGENYTFVRIKRRALSRERCTCNSTPAPKKMKPLTVFVELQQHFFLAFCLCVFQCILQQCVIIYLLSFCVIRVRNCNVVAKVLYEQFHFNKRIKYTTNTDPWRSSTEFLCAASPSTSREPIKLQPKNCHYHMISYSYMI
jgi:hypothetical protein